MVNKNLEKVGMKKRFFGSRLFLFIMFGLAVVVAVGYARAYYQDYKIKQEIKNLQDDISFQNKKKINSLNILKYVSSSSYVEDQARIELNMKKPGESVVFVNDPNSDTKNEVVADNDSTSGQFISNRLKWFYYFIHKPLLKEE
ncbi:MAG: septum formation initiator family protein [Candidatus Magasanikbacteria bacterium]